MSNFIIVLFFTKKELVNHLMVKIKFLGVKVTADVYPDPYYSIF